MQSQRLLGGNQALSGQEKCARRSLRAYNRSTASRTASRHQTTQGPPTLDLAAGAARLLVRVHEDERVLQLLLVQDRVELLGRGADALGVAAVDHVDDGLRVGVVAAPVRPDARLPAQVPYLRAAQAGGVPRATSAGCLRARAGACAMTRAGSRAHCQLRACLRATHTALPRTVSS